MNISETEVGKVYSFAMVSPVIYGARIEKARLSAIGDSTLAKMIAPIEQQYAQIFPNLPSGSPYTPNDCKYYIFKQMNGEVIAIADQWIVSDSVEEISRIVFSIKIYDGNLGDAARIKAALAAIGKTEVTIDTV